MPGSRNAFKDHVWITTYSDKRFNLFGDDPSEICIEDIGHALSNQCRYTGHVTHFYSVAQHSVLVTSIVEWLGGNQGEQRQALFHDASEAYLSDMAAPFKAQVVGYHKLEAMIEKRIEEKYQLIGKCDIVKKADWLALFVEAENLINADSRDWVGWDEHGQEAQELRIEIIPQLPRDAKSAFFAKAFDLGFGI